MSFECYEPEFPQRKAGSFSEKGKILAAIQLCVEEIQRGHYRVFHSYLSRLDTLLSFWNVLQGPSLGYSSLSSSLCPQFSGLWLPFLCLVSVGLILRLLWVTFGPHRKIRIKIERNFWSHQVLSPAVEGNHTIWYLSNTYLVPSWNNLGFLPSLLLLRGCLYSQGYKPSSNFQPKYVQGSLGCV